jgi:hypothetical protein
MRDFKIDDIPSRTGWDEYRDRQQFRARVKTVLGWVFLLACSGGIGAIIALTTFAP